MNPTTALVGSIANLLGIVLVVIGVCWLVYALVTSGGWFLPITLLIIGVVLFAIGKFVSSRVDAYFKSELGSHYKK